MSHPCTRRSFTQLVLAAAPVLALSIPALLRAAVSTSARPDSKVAGVQLGLNVPYSLGGAVTSGDEILAQCVGLGLSAVELRTQPIEAFLGAPAHLVGPRARVTSPAAAAANAETLAGWRSRASAGRAAEFRRQYENAGVKIEILKVDRLFSLTDAELDFVFALAGAVGARALSSEISKQSGPEGAARDDTNHQRIGRFAAAHRLPVGYHGHASTTPEHWERAFAQGEFNSANVDIGHFVAGNESSVLDFLRQHHQRVTHVHIKDRKRHNGPNVPFGEGDTPIREVLRLIRDQRWNIQATIEFEYKVPPESNRLTEIARALNYCRDALA